MLVGCSLPVVYIQACLYFGRQAVSTHTSSTADVGDTWSCLEETETARDEVQLMAKICARGHHRSGLKEGPKCDFAVGSRGKLHWADSTRLEHERHTQQRRAQGCMRRPPAMIRRFWDQGAAFRFFIVSFVLAITPTRNSPLLTTYLALLPVSVFCICGAPTTPGRFPFSSLQLSSF